MRSVTLPLLAPELRPLGRGEEPASPPRRSGSGRRATWMKRLRSSRSSARRRISCFWRLQGELGLDPGQDHREVERLRDVVVRPEPQGLHHVLGGVPRGGHDHRQVGLRPPLAQPLEHVDARRGPASSRRAGPGRTAAPRSSDRAPLAVLGDLHLEAAAAQPAREHVPVELVVVHHQQAHAAGRRGAPASGAGPARADTVGSSTAGGTGGGSGSRNTTGAPGPGSGAPPRPRPRAPGGPPRGSSRGRRGTSRSPASRTSSSRSSA